MRHVGALTLYGIHTRLNPIVNCNYHALLCSTAWMLTQDHEQWFQARKQQMDFMFNALTSL